MVWKISSKTIFGRLFKVTIFLLFSRESVSWNPNSHHVTKNEKFNVNLLRRGRVISNALRAGNSDTVLQDFINGKSYSSQNEKEDENVLYGPDVNSSKPPLDKKLYRQILLKKNGLRVLLISDVPAINQKLSAEEHPTDEGGLTDQDNFVHQGSNGDSPITGSNEEASNENTCYEDFEDDEEEGDGLRKAAASLVVGAGSYHDPPEAMGMAHFLEHMLFMGTKKYPTENAYDAFLSNNGGSDNACTGFEHTTYYFDVAQEKLFQAMDMFAQFFIDPLLTPDAADREIKSINSEFELIKNSDYCRLEQLLFSTSGKNADEHPYAKFGWGNMRSLKDVPKLNNVDALAELRKFFDQYYYATNMGLVVIGAFSLDELQDQVIKCFSDIPANPRFKSSLTPIIVSSDKKYHKTWNDITIRSPMKNFGMPFAPSSLGKVYRAVPVEDRHSLSITWQLPPQQENWKSRPCDYLGHLLGHEGQGSLLSALKQKSWVTSCYAGMGYEGAEYASSHALFTVSFSLSEKGVKYWHEIVNLVYAYIGMIRYFCDTSRSLPDYLYDEFRKMNEISYKFADEQTPANAVDIVYDFAPDRCLPPERVLDGYSLLLAFDETLIKSILEVNLTPYNARVDITSSTFGQASNFSNYPADESHDDVINELSKCHKIGAVTFDPKDAGIPYAEPNFGTRYWAHVIPTDIIESWNKAALPTLPPRQSQLHLPVENPFVPTKFDLKPFSGDELNSLQNEEDIDESDTLLESSFQFPTIPPPISKSRLPKLMIDNSLLKLWWLQDRKFKRPVAELRLKITSPNSNIDPLHCACSELLSLLWRDAVTEVSYQASLGGLEFSNGDVSEGFTLRVDGFDDKLQHLTSKLLTILLSFAGKNNLQGLPSTIKEGRFEACLEILKRRYSNTGMQASEMSTDIRLECLIKNLWSVNTKASALQNIDENSFMNVVSSIVQNMYIEAFYHGNCDESDAEEAVKLITELLNEHSIKTIPKDKLPHQYVTKAPLSTKNKMIKVPNKDKEDKNTSVEVYFQVGPDNLEQRVLLDLLAQIMYEPFYDQVRTKDQFGYSVSVSARWTFGVMGLYFQVVTSSKTVGEVEKRVEKFLVDFRQNLETMSDEIFMENLVGLANNKLQKYNSLEEECNEMWSEIVCSRYDWQCMRKEALQLRKITKAMLLEVFDNWFAPFDEKGNRCSRRLLTFAAEGAMECYNGASIDQTIEQFHEDIDHETWGKINLNVM